MAWWLLLAWRSNQFPLLCSSGSKCPLYSLSVVPHPTPWPTTLYLYALDAQRGKACSSDHSSCISLIQAQPHVCMHICTDIHAHTHKYACSHRHKYTHTHTHTNMHAPKETFMHTNIHTHTNTHTHTYSHTHTHILSLTQSFIHLFTVLRKLAAGVLIVGIEVAWKEESCYFLRCGGMGCRGLRQRELGACCQQTPLA